MYDLHVGMHRTCDVCTDSTFQCDLHYINLDCDTKEPRVASQSQNMHAPNPRWLHGCRDITNDCRPHSTCD